MKKFLLFLGLLFMLTGCDYLHISFTGFDTEGSEDTTKTTSRSTTSGTTTAYTDKIDQATCLNYKQIHENSAYGDYSNVVMPSTGDVNVLVIPVYFYGDYIDKARYNTTEKMADLEYAFFGDGTRENSWETLKSYYYKSSYGKLNITGEITPWYQTKYQQEYYEYNFSSADILDEALEYFDSSYDYKDFDSDDDGTIDAVYLVYAYEYSLNSNDMFWAWCSWREGSVGFGINKMSYAQHVWASFEFIYEGRDSYNTTGISSDTFIHETGHLLGSDDFYDYDPDIGCGYGIGGYNMMDSNCGDMCSLNKILYGWTKPTIVKSGTQTLTLRSFSTYGDSIIVCPSWNDSTNIMTEFFIIDFYNRDGLSDDYYFLGENYRFDKSGIRIYHVNAKPAVYDDDYFQVFFYDNSYTDYSFISLVSESKSNGFLSTVDFVLADDFTDESDLFCEGDSFAPYEHFNQYQDKSLLDFRLTVYDIGTDSATITISFE